MITLPSDNGKARAVESEIPNEIISLAAPEVGEDPSLAHHPGIICSGASCAGINRWIRGVRYKCTVCRQKDFCSACVGQADNGHDPEHPLYECIGPSEFIEARYSATGELVFDQTPADGLPELLVLNNLELNDDAGIEPEAEPKHPLRHMPKSPCGLSLGNIEHFPDAGILAKVILGQITLYDYGGCQLRDLPGPRPAIARLVELKPGNDGDKVECELALTRLGDQKPYTTRRHAVYLGDRHFIGVSAAAFEALQAFRDPDESKLFWIEELCTDPQHEKRFQNRSRSLIMSKASKVVMWAGSNSDDLENAFALTAQLQHYCESDIASMPTPASVVLNPDLPSLDSEDWQSLFRFFSSDILNCQWELDDVSFAESPVLRCGEYEIDWWNVIGIAKMLSRGAWKEYRARLSGVSSSSEQKDFGI